MPETLTQEKLEKLITDSVPQIKIHAEESEIKKLIEKKNKIQKNRQTVERQWFSNLAFLIGRHHFAIEQRHAISGLEERITWWLTDLDRKKKTLRTSNYILPLYRSLLARFLQMKSQITVDPTTAREEDKAAARVGSELLEDFWQQANKTNPILSQKYSGMKQVLIKLFSYLLSMGRGYLNPYFNPSTTGKSFLDGEVIEGKIGHVEVEVNHPLEIYPDPLGTFVIRARIASVEEIYNAYGIELEPEKIVMSDFESQVASMLDDTQRSLEIENAVRLYTYWELPNKKNPKGRQVHFTEKKELTPLDNPLPEETPGMIPLVRFNYFEIPLIQDPQAMIEQLIPLQEEYNYTLSRIYAYKKWFAGKIMYPKGCDVETAIDDEIGQLIKYNASVGRPDFVTPPSFPAQLLRDLDRIRRDMEDIAAAHEVSLSRLPSGVKSGVAIENLSELDNSQIAPNLIHLEEQLSLFAEMLLKIMEVRYSEPRLVAISGNDFTKDIKAFTGEQAKGNRRVRISLGSTLPFGRQARQDLIFLLKKEGIIGPEKVQELLEFSDIESVFKVPEKEDEKAIMERLIRGEPQEPLPWETHPIRIKVLTDFMNTEDFRKLDPQIQQLFIQRRQAQQEQILKEQEALMPKPPVPQISQGALPE